MADELAGEGFSDVQLVGGKGGVFDIHANGKLVYSKHDEGRFPIPGEVMKKLKEA